jgi:hypothetical protein
MKAVVYDFCESRAGEHARRFLGDWRGSLTCDDFSGYKALIASGVTEVGCLAHARRKFFDLHAANKSQIAEFALQQFAKVYEIEREVKELARSAPSHPAAANQAAADACTSGCCCNARRCPTARPRAKALDYSLRRWEALTRFVDDGQLPVDNNWIENQIRPIAIGATTGCSRAACARASAAAVMSLIQSARMNGHDPYAYLKDVLTAAHAQGQPASGLLPHRWRRFNRSTTMRLRNSRSCSPMWRRACTNISRSTTVCLEVMPGSLCWLQHYPIHPTFKMGWPDAYGSSTAAMPCGQPLSPRWSQRLKRTTGWLLARSRRPTSGVCTPNSAGEADWATAACASSEARPT